LIAVIITFENLKIEQVKKFPEYVFYMFKTLPSMAFIDLCLRLHQNERYSGINSHFLRAKGETFLYFQQKVRYIKV